MEHRRKDDWPDYCTPQQFQRAVKPFELKPKKDRTWLVRLALVLFILAVIFFGWTGIVGLIDWVS